MTSQQTQAEANKAIIRRYRQAHNQNDMAALDQIVAADLITHSQLPNVPAGREGGKMVHQGSLAAFPDGKTTTDDLIAEGDKVVERFTLDLIAEGDKVVERFTLVGTHKGDFMGIPASGKSVRVTGMSIFRIANGKIVEHWGENDAMSLLIQLGVLPTPGQ
jgi:steroid delta-isomerase-like uncharacterized protein